MTLEYIQITVIPPTSTPIDSLQFLTHISISNKINIPSFYDHPFKPSIGKNTVSLTSKHNFKKLIFSAEDNG
jgi:hypothetical protein